MKWDIFRPREKARGNPVEEAVAEKEKVIERFAPREYRTERERFYYNYRAMPLYRGTLLTFLDTVSKRERLKEEPATLARNLFLALRDFYDPRRKASPEAIVRDPAFRRKFREVYRYFYNRTCPSFEEIGEWFLGEQHKSVERVLNQQKDFEKEHPACQDTRKSRGEGRLNAGDGENRNERK